ncbi:response regulator [Bradyrhizobium sp. NBAIM03]|uniref:response regulator transcription factor n=1 Tax=Bradyrhizobium sp. NBAIM03 TaxID=2793816 RepID=UPI001CD2E060|nr:response regulator [Bradyrhizobium sp. NBAIM03]
MAAGVDQLATIALVDDDRGFREALEGLILSHGYRVWAFASARAFLVSTERSKVDCIILDARMPGMSGLELQARLNQEGVSTPIIFLTSYADPVMKRQALDEGAMGFFGKPVDHMALLECIRLCLARGRGPSRA